MLLHKKDFGKATSGLRRKEILDCKKKFDIKKRRLSDVV
jgi:hypothetical protein